MDWFDCIFAFALGWVAAHVVGSVTHIVRTRAPRNCW